MAPNDHAIPQVLSPVGTGRQNILVVKLGAFGNIILSLARSRRSAGTMPGRGSAC
jgi:hypothetical protein